VGDAWLATLEGLKTCAARPWRFATAVLLVAAFVGGALAIDLFAANGALVSLSALEDAGADVLVVRDEAGTLDGPTCERLERQPGVSASGGVSAPSVESLAGVGGVSFRAIHVTQGYLRVIYPKEEISAAVNAVLGPDIAQEIGIGRWGLVTTAAGDQFRTQLATHQSRALDRGRWINILQAAPGTVRECWVAALPGSLQSVKDLLPWAFATTSQLRIESLVSEDRSLAAARAWTTRPTQWAWVVAACGAGAVVGMVLVQRRHEYALYKLLGGRMNVIVVVAAIEGWAITVLGTMISLSFCLVVCSFLGETAATLTSMTLSKHLLATSVCGLLTIGCSLIAVGGNTAHAIRTRR